MVKTYRRWCRPLLLLTPLALLCAWLGPMTPASAAPDAKLVLLMDSSGSMKEKAGSETKISIAKHALNTVVAKLPATAQTGMRVYGATVFSRKDKGACTDSQLVVPIGTGNREALKTAIASYKPYGETPISYSLIQAAKDLGSTGQRTVVLVSDGEETCNADPCDTAATLAKQGIDLRFDVIGLKVSGAARSQLQCIADKGHGTYYDADSAAQIQDSLDKLATRAFRPFKLSGTPIKGSTDQSTPTTAQPGQYVDQFPGNRDDLYYRVPRTMTGSTIHVGLSADVAGETAASLLLSTAKEAYCGSDTALVINIEGSKSLLTGELELVEAEHRQRLQHRRCRPLQDLPGDQRFGGRPVRVADRRRTTGGRQPHSAGGGRLRPPGSHVGGRDRPEAGGAGSQHLRRGDARPGNLPDLDPDRREAGLRRHAGLGSAVAGRGGRRAPDRCAGQGVEQRGHLEPPDPLPAAGRVHPRRSGGDAEELFRHDAGGQDLSRLFRHTAGRLPQSLGVRLPIQCRAPGNLLGGDQQEPARQRGRIPGALHLDHPRDRDGRRGRSAVPSQQLADADSDSTPTPTRLRRRAPVPLGRPCPAAGPAAVRLRRRTDPG